MKERIIILFIITVIVGIYLNRSYAYFYHYMSDHYQADPNQVSEHFFKSKKPDAKTIQYVALGDSLTAGAGAKLSSDSFPWKLSEKMSEADNINLLNLGIPGAASRDVKLLEIERAIAANPDIITLLIGTNDIHSLVPARDFENEISYILDELIAKTKAKIFVLNIPYLGTSKIVLPPYGTFYKAKTKEFNRIIQNTCARHGIEIIDLYSRNKNFEKENGFYSPDSFHPDKAGYALWADLIYANINK